MEQEEEKPKCLYPKCTNVPKCYQDNPDYCPYNGHSEWKEGTCPGSEYGHKWICRNHWDLLEFLRLSGCLEIEVRRK